MTRILLLLVVVLVFVPAALAKQPPKPRIMPECHAACHVPVDYKHR